MEAQLRESGVRKDRPGLTPVDEYKVVALGERMVAYRRDLEPIEIGEEFFCDRELSPYVLTGRTVEGLRERIDQELA